ncbi:hypothetical protein PFISCL1PPCAC_23482, partial [Pristionchus fissidentatus]
MLHRNLLIIVYSSNIFYLFSLFFRFLQIAYELRVIEYEGLYSFPIPLLVITRFTAYINLLLFLTSVLVERSLATLFIIDYEKKNRYYISITISGSSLVCSGILSYLLVYESLNPILLAALLLFVNLISVVLFFLLLRYNKTLKTTKCISSSTVTYCLSIRKQVRENIRTMNMLRIGGIVLVAAIFVLIPSLIFVPYFIDYDDSAIQISTASLNAITA